MQAQALKRLLILLRPCQYGQRLQGYNKVYKEVFAPIQATRTTLAITALPTPIAVEFYVIALP